MSKFDDRHAQILDEQFEDILYRVKPYLLNLAISSDSRHCRLWLERFDHAEDQRSLRNDYLLELYRQLKNGYLRVPFNKPPENGRLVPLSKFHRLVHATSLFYYRIPFNHNLKCHCTIFNLW
ncbi:PREDICTED: centrosomal protein of 112 kDa-like [Ceratosolen solmsi marchali]|uniref:Centrosomal protein of 112 kDa-like n=1 Tax=Ceratosolen solmsi marchali TaxID=326594 RepID=A0AAJ6YS68_9HYME|nr:PREDICTED: centrosomal protein of 112 kDa-like [Ceratosolen solmsi marchali]